MQSQATLPPLLALPLEVQLKIWSYLTPAEIVSGMLVAKILAENLLANALWKDKYKLHFENDLQIVAAKDDLNWLRAFFIQYVSKYESFYREHMHPNGYVAYALTKEAQYPLYRRIFTLTIEGRAKELHDTLADRNLTRLDYSLTDNSKTTFVKRASLLLDQALAANDAQAIRQYQDVLDVIYSTYQAKIPAEIYSLQRLRLHAIACRQSLADTYALFTRISEDQMQALISHAINNGNQETVEFLINIGADQHALCHALSVAIEGKCHRVIHFLCDKLQTETLDQQSSESITLSFEKAYASGDLLSLKYVMPLMPLPLPQSLHDNLGADSTIECLRYVMEKDPTLKWPALFSIIDNSNHKLLDYYAQNKININAEPGTESALTRAIKSSRSLVGRLLDMGADVHHRDQQDLTPMVIALRNGIGFTSVSICVDIARHDPSILEKNGAVLLEELFRAEHLEKKIILEQWLDMHPALANIQLRDGKTPLMIACKDKLYSVAKLLIEHGADVHATVIEQDETRTALYYAALRPENDMGRAAFHHLTSAVSLPELLLENGADPYQRFGGRTSLLHLLCDYGSGFLTQPIIERLARTYPSLLEMLDEQGNTALGRLLLASSEGYYPAAAIALIELGANINEHVNNHGQQLSLLFLLAQLYGGAALNLIVNGADVTLAKQNCKELDKTDYHRHQVLEIIAEGQFKAKALRRVDKVISAVNQENWKHLSIFNRNIKNDKATVHTILGRLRESVATHDKYQFASPIAFYSHDERRLIKAFKTLKPAYQFLKYRNAKVLT